MTFGLSYQPHANRGDRVPVVVSAGFSIALNTSVNMRQPPPLQKADSFRSANLTLSADDAIVVEIGTEKTLEESRTPTRFRSSPIHDSQ